MKKIIFIVFIAVFSFCLFSCGKNKLSDFDKLVNAIYESETILAGYNESSTIKDGDLDVYYKDTSFVIQRGQKVKSEVEIVEKTLSTSGTSMYDETVSKYRTIDNVKYVEINGKTYENEYKMPTYYLTFVLSKEFLKEGYSLTVNENDYTLKASVLDNKISSLFLNKSMGKVSNLSIEIIVKDNRLRNFKATYSSTTGNVTSIDTNYLYADRGTGVAVFYLEGGICQSSTNRISFAYDFDGSIIDRLIADPNNIFTEENHKILKDGYHIEGWYQTKIENEDGTITYEDKWDFNKDKMDLKGVTLYANWEINRLYTYELYYKNESGEDVFLDSYEVKEGEVFYDLFMDNKDVEGYTKLGYLDSEGNPWNDKFTHPGGDSDLAIKVYADLIEGEYTVVKTARQLKTALNRSENIYLMNDIDLDGSEINYDSYSGIIQGNGYKITNFKIGYNDSRTALEGPLDDLKGSKDHLYVSLFFELKDATIMNVTFDNIIIDINTRNTQIKYIIFAPLAIISTNTKLENVSFTGSFTITRVPECEITKVTDGFFYQTNNVLIDEFTKLEISE